MQCSGNRKIASVEVTESSIRKTLAHNAPGIWFYTLMFKVWGNKGDELEPFRTRKQIHDKNYTKI